MSNYPKILDFINHVNFNLIDEEISFLKEAKELIEIGQYRYSLFPIWSCVISNIQRRIENFGINNLLAILDNKNVYDKLGNSLKDRWLNMNEYNIIDYAKQLNIINHICHDLVTSLYWMKTDNSSQKEFEKEEVLSILFLLEKNLFINDFKSDQRKKENQNSSLKRRKNDVTNSTSIPSQTHQELLLKSNVKKFEDELKKKVLENHIVDKYG